VQHKPGTDAFVAMLLMRAKIQHGGDQIFFFGPKGDPLHVARKPIRPSELTLFDEALALLPGLEETEPRPLRKSDPEGRFTLAALDEAHEIFLMIFDATPQAEAREKRATAIHKDLARHADKLRDVFRGILR
jgi:hypothetical protein